MANVMMSHRGRERSRIRLPLVLGAVLSPLALVNAAAHAGGVSIPERLSSVDAGVGKSEVVWFLVASAAAITFALLYVVRDVDRWRIGAGVAAVALLLTNSVTYGVGDQDSRSLSAVGLAVAAILVWLAVGFSHRRGGSDFTAS